MKIPNRNRPRRKVRQEEAAKRQEASDKLTPQQKLAKITGSNLRAMKERSKLQKLIDAQKEQKAAPKAEAVVASPEEAKKKKEAKKVKQQKKEKKDKSKAAKK